jgi:hypothetical protein
MGKKIDLVGRKFGRLEVVSRAGSDKRGEVLWKCKCDCGNECKVLGSNLRSGHTKSCGCYNNERRKEIHITHKMSDRPIYGVWAHMIQRCTNPKATFYYRYGGRGIKVCEEWLKFDNFYKDMGDCPENGTIDRIDNDGDYEPENCRWSSQKINARNKSNNVNITYNGKTQCIAAWEEELGFKHGTLWNRLYTFKWPIERAMTEPVISPNINKIEFRGKVQSLTAHARDCGIGRTTVDARLAMGWSLEAALTAPKKIIHKRK